MKIKYWMAVYPFHLAPGATAAPFPNNQPISEVGQGAKLVAFTVEIPDDLFGEIEVVATMEINTNERPG